MTTRTPDLATVPHTDRIPHVIRVVHANAGSVPCGVEPHVPHVRRWQRLNPSFAVSLVTADDLPGLLPGDMTGLLATAETQRQWADMSKLMILATHGGVVADGDALALRPIASLCGLAGAFVGSCAQGWEHDEALLEMPVPVLPVLDVLGGAPGSAFWTFAAARLAAWAAPGGTWEDVREDSERASQRCGSKFLARVLRHYDGGSLTRITGTGPTVAADTALLTAGTCLRVKESHLRRDHRLPGDPLALTVVPG